MVTAEAPLTDSDRGYLSAESKRRFTLVAGVLGAVFFLAQTILPMLLMFLLMVPMIFDHEVSLIDLDGAALWRDELWVIQRNLRVDPRDPKGSAPTRALARFSLADLSSAGPSVPLDSEADWDTTLLPVDERLWILGPNSVEYYRDGALTRLTGASRPPRASRPFVYEGRPAVVSLSTAPALATLNAEDGRAEWRTKELPLDLPPEGGSLRALQAIEAGDGLYLFAQTCTESPDHCSLLYRELEERTWTALVDEVCSCGTWTAIAFESRPAVLVSERREGRQARLELVTADANGPKRHPIEVEDRRISTDDWRPFSSRNGILLVSQGMPGSLRLAEWSGGRVTRYARKKGSFPFPFGSGMMLFMIVPQLLPILLSLVLAFILTVQMRRHRVQQYVFEGHRRNFASLWQRALAQLVDIVPFVVAFLVPSAWMWRVFSDPESFLEAGPSAAIPLAFFGFFVGELVFAVLVLVVFSYFEGRFGKTPGKWLLRIRVLGTDLQPCGFKRAFVRNLLTFVDGFFSFLVGALLVALTENWQRLGDLAARTIVVSDAAPAAEA